MLTLLFLLFHRNVKYALLLLCRTHLLQFADLYTTQPPRQDGLSVPSHPNLHITAKNWLRGQAPPGFPSGYSYIALHSTVFSSTASRRIPFALSPYVVSTCPRTKSRTLDPRRLQIDSISFFVYDLNKVSMQRSEFGL